MPEELKPCPVPWCGGPAKISNDRGGQTSDSLSRFFVYCRHCGLRGPSGKRKRDGGTEADAIAAWNQRPQDAVLIAAQKVAGTMRTLDDVPARDAKSVRRLTTQLETDCRCLYKLLPRSAPVPVPCLLDKRATCKGNGWKNLYDEENGVSGNLPCSGCAPVKEEA